MKSILYSLIDHLADCSARLRQRIFRARCREKETTRTSATLSTLSSFVRTITSQALPPLSLEADLCQHVHFCCSDSCEMAGRLHWRPTVVLHSANVHSVNYPNSSPANVVTSKSLSSDAGWSSLLSRASSVRLSMASLICDDACSTFAWLASSTRINRHFLAVPWDQGRGHV